MHRDQGNWFSSIERERVVLNPVDLFSHKASGTGDHLPYPHIPTPRFPLSTVPTFTHDVQPIRSPWGLRASCRHLEVMGGSQAQAGMVVR